MAERQLRPVELIARSYIIEAVKNASTDQIELATQILALRLSQQIPPEEALSRCFQILGTAQPAQKVNAILNTPPEPISPRRVFDMRNKPTTRQKARNWTPYEDQRLLAGILKFGLDNWPIIAEFVGSGRNRSQCSQRWYRGLNPSIYKGPWTKEEDDKLVEMVQKLGEKSWRQIATCLGTRSDVQCRYHYQQLVKTRQYESPVTDPQPTTPQSEQSKSGSDCIVLRNNGLWDCDFLKDDAMPEMAFIDFDY